MAVETTTTKRLGDRLIDKGLITLEQLEVALGEQRRFHRPVGEILISLGFVRQADITAMVAEDLGLAFVEAADIQPDPLILSALDPHFVRETLAFPYALEDGVLKAVMVQPDDRRKVSAVRERFPYPLDVAVTTEGALVDLIREHLQVKTSRAAEILGGIQEGAGLDEFPVEEVTLAILIDGVNRMATDIHVEPEGLVTRVRYRVDGILHGGENLPAELTPSIVSRIKILSNLDISERRRPQDGRLKLTMDERAVDMRVSIMPSQYGENVVLRILDTAGGILRLGALGVGETQQRVLERVASRPHGLFLVTGPTGSGKTTTLYAMLGSIDAMQRKVATIEDPIEYQLPLVRQSQADPSIGFTFSAGLRSLLRQDPDVILVGEIRDQETADMAIKASMTGHLVLSTLHTNSAIGAVPRLVDMGIEPYLVEDCLIGAISQRLVRRVCSSCAEEVVASEEELEWLQMEAALLKRGRGCERCDGSGYAGRTALMETFFPDSEVAELIRGGAGADRIEEVAVRNGFRPMDLNGRELVGQGETTVEEVLRVGRGHRLSGEEREGI